MKNFNVLSLGGFISEEGTLIALESFAKFYHQLTAKHQRLTQLVMIHKGAIRDLAESKAIGLNIKKKITFVHFEKQNQVEEEYKKAAVFMLPEKEKIRQMIPEAYAYSLPVLCYRQKEMEDYVDQLTGMLVEDRARSQNIDQFAEKLNMLYYDPEVLKILQKGALQKYNKQFSWGGKMASAER